MKDSTVNAIQTMAAADSETTPEQLRAILAACKSTAPRRKLITPRQAMEILDVSRLTLRRWELEGKLSPVRLSSQKIRFDLAEVERLAYVGIKP